MKVITFSTCFYVLKSKFNPDIYVQWMNNFLSIVNNFNLVIYTDNNSINYINTNNNPNIKIIIKPIEEFYTYKYKNYWEENHKKNNLLNDRTDWKLNMLWSEKIWFVNDTIINKYFDTDYYGWCDIGYFRNRSIDTNTDELKNWASLNIINVLKKDKIHYGIVNSDKYISVLEKIVNNKNELGLPVHPIPMSQVSVAGGFFIIHKKKINWWKQTYDDKLNLYFKNDYLVKDDQIILIDCILTNKHEFLLFSENISGLDNWFMFQRILN